jgi:hypothetical protein
MSHLNIEYLSINIKTSTHRGKLLTECNDKFSYRGDEKKGKKSQKKETLVLTVGSPDAFHEIRECESIQMSGMSDIGCGCRPFTNVCVPLLTVSVHSDVTFPFESLSPPSPSPSHAGKANKLERQTAGALADNRRNEMHAHHCLTLHYATGYLSDSFAVTDVCRRTIPTQHNQIPP